MRHSTRLLTIGATCMLALGLAAAPVLGAETAPSLEDAVLTGKCSLCHSSKRVLTMDPEKIKTTVERMQKMNPDWITTTDKDHVVEVLAKVLKDPALVAGRKAWQEAVERGEALYRDPKLGKSGFTCAACHEQGALKNVADAYPQYDLKLRRLVSLEERIQLMIREKMEGEPLPSNSQQMFDLLAYLKSRK